MPKNSGLVVFIVSPLWILSKLTVLEEGVEVGEFSRLNLELDEELSGNSSRAFGVLLAELSLRLVKSCIWPMIIGGAGLAAIGYIWADETPLAPVLTESSIKVETSFILR